MEAKYACWWRSKIDCAVIAKMDVGGKITAYTYSTYSPDSGIPVEGVTADNFQWGLENPHWKHLDAKKTYQEMYENEAAKKMAALGAVPGKKIKHSFQNVTKQPSAGNRGAMVSSETFFVDGVIEEVSPSSIKIQTEGGIRAYPMEYALGLIQSGTIVLLND